MKTKKAIITILVFVAVIILAPLIFRPANVIAPMDGVVDNNENPKIGLNDSDLISFSIKHGQEVSGIMKVKGEIKGGYFFEGNILINVLDANKKVIKQGNAMATTEWMTVEPVTFETNIDFAGFPKGKAYIEIHNDNASGLPENDKSILIPIVIK